MVIISVLLFVIYYFSTWNHTHKHYKYLFLFLCISCSFFMRFVIPIELNKDYAGYSIFYDFDDPESLLDFLISEPYLYILYKFFNLFSVDKIIILKSIYWFNTFLTTIFFTWLALKKDVSVWKKNIFFVFYFFLFGFVVLRNAPAYILFTLFSYHGLRNTKFNYIFFMPFMHLSTLPILVSYFHKKKHYLKYLTILVIASIPLVIFYIYPIINSLIEFESIKTKSEAYLGSESKTGIFHIIYFIFITIISFTIVKVHKNLHPIIITTAFIYYIFFFINPVLGFRFSPYFIITWLLIKNQTNKYSQLNKILNYGSLLTVFYFIFTLYDTHFL